MSCPDSVHVFVYSPMTLQLYDAWSFNYTTSTSNIVSHLEYNSCSQSSTTCNTYISALRKAKGEGQLVPVHAMKVYRRSRDRALLNLNLVARLL
jgi:hypothetical protein